MSAAMTVLAPAYLAAATSSEPIGPAPLTRTSLPARRSCPADRVHGDRERFGEGAAQGVHAVGQRADLRSLGELPLAEPAVGVRVEGRRTEVPDPRVEVGAARQAVRHGSISHQFRGVHRDRLADLEVVDAGAQLGDPAGHLMAEDERRLQGRGPGGAVAPVREVRAADPAPFDVDDYLAGSGDRLGTVIDAEVVRSVDYDGFHTASSRRTMSRPRTSGPTAAEIRVIRE